MGDVNQSAEKCVRLTLEEYDALTGARVELERLKSGAGSSKTIDAFSTPGAANAAIERLRTALTWYANSRPYELNTEDALLEYRNVALMALQGLPDEVPQPVSKMSVAELRDIADCSPERCHDALMWAADDIERLHKLLSANDTTASYKCTECGSFHLRVVEAAADRPAVETFAPQPRPQEDFMGAARRDYLMRGTAGSFGEVLREIYELIKRPPDERPINYAIWRSAPLKAKDDLGAQSAADGWLGIPGTPEKTNDTQPVELDDRLLAWTCSYCAQLNSGWSKECGRCGQPRPPRRDSSASATSPDIPPRELASAGTGKTAVNLHEPLEESPCPSGDSAVPRPAPLKHKATVDDSCNCELCQGRRAAVCPACGPTNEPCEHVPTATDFL